MVWESGCVVIVMLTPLSENGVKQCHHYWPDEGSDVYHIYEVRQYLDAVKFKESQITKKNKKQTNIFSPFGVVYVLRL